MCIDRRSFSPFLLRNQVNNINHRHLKRMKTGRGLHYSVILSVMVIFGFYTSLFEVRSVSGNSLSLNNVGFQFKSEHNDQEYNYDATNNDDSIIEPSFQITDTLIITGTATIPPLPTYTLIFPESTEEMELLQKNRQPFEKQSSSQYLETVRRFWPIFLLVVLWALLGLWFVFSQMIIK